MNRNIKIILSIVSLLAIGFMAGFHGHRVMMKKHVHRIAKERIGPNYGDRMMELLEVSDQQRTQLKPIFEKYGDQLSEMKTAEHAKRKIVFGQMKEEIRVHLDADQIKKLDEMRRKRKHRVAGGR